jgi:hypothetical protein
MAAAALHLAIDEEAGPRHATAASNPRFLLELIVADLHWSALQIGSLTLLAAAAAAPGSSAELHAGRHLVYDDTRVMRLALRYGHEAGFADDVSRKLDQLYVAIGESLTQMAAVVQPASLSPALREKLTAALPALRKLCQTAVECLVLLESVTRASLNLDYGEDSVAIRQYLGRALRGDLSDIDRRGVLYTPQIKQRRQSPRAKISVACRLACAAGEYPCEIVDVSREGLGLVCKCEIAQGDAVTVLIGGRRLEATVKRLSGFQLGLVLTTPLQIGDPLFTGG